MTAPQTPQPRPTTPAPIVPPAAPPTPAPCQPPKKPPTAAPLAVPAAPPNAVPAARPTPKPAAAPSMRSELSSITGGGLLVRAGLGPALLELGPSVLRSSACSTTHRTVSASNLTAMPTLLPFCASLLIWDNSLD